MQLAAEQVDRYRRVMGSLLAYVDRRLRITRRLPPPEERRLAPERTLLVARELWRNLQLVDDFVRDNPDALGEADIGMARAWRQGIYCRCAVVGLDERGNFVVETDAGRFSAQVVGTDGVGGAPTVPIGFRSAMLPVGDAIIFGVPVDGMRIVDEGEVAWLRRRASVSGFEGTAVTADDLRRRCASAANARFDDELSVLGRVEATTEVEGFHRGRLVDKTADERFVATEKALGACLEEASDRDLVKDLEAGGCRCEGLDVSSVREALRALDACVTLYGVVSLMDAFDQYVAISMRPLSRGLFVEIAEGGACLPPYNYALWEYEGVTYATAMRLSEVAALASALHILDGRRQTEGMPSSVGQAFDEAHVFHPGQSDELGRLTEGESQRLHECRLALLDEQAGCPRRPVERRMVEEGMLRYLLRLDAVVALRDFVDAHVPDGRDDCRFADEVVFGVVQALSSGGSEVDDAYRWLDGLGLTRCEGTDWSDTLGRMVVNVFNTLPRWGRSGWSLRQLSERLTGRLEYFSPDGTVMKLEGEDACPCGSGRAYGCCCGR